MGIVLAVCKSEIKVSTFIQDFSLSEQGKKLSIFLFFIDNCQFLFTLGQRSLLY